MQIDYSVLVKSLLAWKQQNRRHFRFFFFLGDHISYSFITNLKLIIILTCMQIRGLKLGDNTFAENNAIAIIQTGMSAGFN